MNVAMNGKGPQHLEMPRWQASKPEKREPLRQIDESRVGLEIRARPPNPLSRIRHPDTSTKPPPKLSLPSSVGRNPTIVTGRPSPNELRSMNRIPVVEISEMPNGREPPSAPSSLSPIITIAIHAPTKMSSKRGKPRLIEAPINNLKKRPNSPLRKPRIPLRINPRSGRNCIADQPSRRRKLNIGADPIEPARPGAEAGRHPLRQPPLHATRRHRNDICGERLRKLVGDQSAKRPDQPVGPLCSVDMKHGEKERRRLRGRAGALVR